MGCFQHHCDKVLVGTPSGGDASKPLLQRSRTSQVSAPSSGCVSDHLLQKSNTLQAVGSPAASAPPCNLSSTQLPHQLSIQTRNVLMQQASSLALGSPSHGSGQWAVKHTRMFRECVTMDELAGKAESLEQFNSVSEAIHMLSADGALCPGGFGVMFSKSQKRCCLLYRDGMKDAALGVFQTFLEPEVIRKKLWKDSNTHMLHSGVAASELVNLVPVLTQFDSVSLALQQLNLDDTLCPQGFCAINSRNKGRFFLLHRAEMKDDAFDALHGLFDLGDGVRTTKEERAAINGAVWAYHRNRVLKRDVGEAEIAGNAQYLPEFDSVSSAVAALNCDGHLCAASSCVIWCKALSRYCLLYRKDKKVDALAPFLNNLETNSQALRFTEVPKSFDAGLPFALEDARAPLGSLAAVVGDVLPKNQREFHLKKCQEKRAQVKLDYPKFTEHLSDVQIEILCSYTEDLQPKEKSPYFECNQLMRDGKELGPWRPYADLLFTALQALPDLEHVSVVYRGFQVAMDKLGGGIWEKDSTIVLRGFVSASERQKTMEKFVGVNGSRTMLTLHLLPGTGKRINVFSEFDEEEILLQPDIPFKIVSIADLGNFLTLVECQQIKQ